MSTVVPGIPTGAQVILLREGRVLLMRRCNTGFFDGLYSLPGGHVEAGESVRMTAVRELFEELGVEVQAAALELVGAMHRRSDTNRIDFFLRATAWAGEPRVAEPDKCSGLKWFPHDSLPVDTVPYVRHALAMRQLEPWLIELGWSEPAG